MKKKNSITLYLLLLMGFGLIVTNSCKKKDDAPTKKTPVITWADPADIYTGTLLSANQLNATADVEGTFVYTPALGTKLVIGAHQLLKVVFTPTDAAVNDTASKTVKINVLAKKTPVITWEDPADITNETWLSATQLNATADVPGSFVYTPAINTRLNMDIHQHLKVVFTPTDIATYDTISKSVMINVSQATSFKDIEGNAYGIVVIGSQIWMAQNLKTTKYNDGSSIPLVADNNEWVNLTSAGYCWNGDATYGAYYNWYVVGTGKLAPKGWHVPTETDWLSLQAYLGGPNVAGGKLKETGTSHWSAPNTGATNESGFLALPGGYRSTVNGTFPTKYQNSVWGSSTGNINGFGRFLINYNSSTSDYQTAAGTLGFSIRCIRD